MATATVVTISEMPTVKGRGKPVNPEVISLYGELLKVKTGNVLKIECDSEKERNTLLAGIRNRATADSKGTTSRVAGATFWIGLTGKAPAVRGPRKAKA